uniref:DPPIV_N domain-containing protein n=1 Tax=Angiostrongylus cantonensis TaxID=6313 RepID=A0A158PAG6_ANGCA
MFLSRIASNVGIKKTGEEQHRIFMWGPTGNDYVRRFSGHIYYSDSAESVKPVQISEGGPNWEHGIFDWMYEEEIFGRQSNAVWWSLTGDKIVYLSREKNKENYSRRENYPHTLELPYPKTHEKHLPTYVIKMWDKNLRTLKQIDVQLRDSTAFHYLYGLRWVMLNGKERLVAIWTNRLQNHISVTICDYDTAMCSLVFEHKYDAKKWAEPSDFSSILSSGDAIYMLLPRAQSDGNSYQQIAKLLIELSYLSAGNFDVTKLEAFDIELFDFLASPKLARSSAWCPQSQLYYC